MIIDGRLAVIGSMNLDLRSQRMNSEVALIIRHMKQRMLVQLISPFAPDEML